MHFQGLIVPWHNRNTFDECMGNRHLHVHEIGYGGRKFDSCLLGGLFVLAFELPYFHEIGYNVDPQF